MKKRNTELRQWPQGTVFTVGHSTLPIDRFIALLAAYGIESLMDVRTVPRSRHNPQFNGDALAGSLAAAGIEYVPMQALGGLRRPRKDSVNTGWRNTSFRGYADYMETPAFAEAINALLDEAAKRRTAIMCAELRWMECHRGLISDYLKAAGHEVVHIVSAAEGEPHPYTRQARIAGGHLSYRGLL